MLIIKQNLILSIQIRVVALSFSDIFSSLNSIAYFITTLLKFQLQCGSCLVLDVVKDRAGRLAGSYGAAAALKGKLDSL